MRTAWLNLRHTVSDRQNAFRCGLERIGYRVENGFPRKVSDGDILCQWNRIGGGEVIAKEFEAAGNKVLIAENSTWGNDFNGSQWYTIARNRHNTAGMFPVGGNERWDRLDVELMPWRISGETVILPQRGIGSSPTAMPREWAYQQAGRIRRHPGMNSAIPLVDDLQYAGKVVTWGSGAAVKALMWGIPVESHMPNWIAEQDNTDIGRLDMFRSLAWAQWTIEEIKSGEPFERLL